jgi:hypothetical protein
VNTSFTASTLRALGLNEAGIKAAWFLVTTVTRTARDNAYGAQKRCQSLSEANAEVQTQLAAGNKPQVQVWWRGDATPVRYWAPIA